MVVVTPLHTVLPVKTRAVGNGFTVTANEPALALQHPVAATCERM